MNTKFALAAGVCAAALAGFSDVTSANTVGYMGTETTPSGNKMIAPMFLNVGSPNGTFKLSDLRADASTYDPEEGTAGDLMLTILGPGGTAEKFTEADGVPELVGQVKKFAWYDIPDDTEPGWYDINGMVPWPADKIVFKASQAFWTVGYSVRLITSGQVGITDAVIPTKSSGNIGCGNPFATNIKLSDMYAEADSYDPEEGTAGDLMLTVLGTGGTAAKYTDADGIPELVGQVKKFAWYDIPDDTDAGWYDINGMIPWPADKVEFEPGQGFWTVGYGVVLHISVPQALKSL